MPATHVPTYPVVDPSPSMPMTIANFGAKEFLYITAYTTAGYATGWFGSRKPFRGANSKFVGGIGLFAGFMYSLMRTTQRLVGLEPNAAEVAKYGALTPEQLAKRLNQLNVPNKQLIDSE